MIDTLLTDLGFSVTEVRVYLALAEVGKANAALLAKRIALPRSSVYTALESLTNRGVVSVEETGGTACFLANKPEAISRMVEREHEAAVRTLESKRGTAAEAEKLIADYFRQENYSVPKLRFFEGTRNVESMLFDHCAEWQSSIAKYDNTWWGYQDGHFVETYRKWLDQYWNSMQEGEKIQLFSNRSETEKKLKRRIANRTIKTMPKQFLFSSTIWILGDFVVTIMTRQQPHYAFQLEDAVFASNQRLVFRMLWDLVDV